MIIILSSAKIPFPGKVHSLVLGAKLRLFVVVVHSVMYDSAAPWTAARQASLSLTICQSLLKLMSIESVMPSNHHNLCCPLVSLANIKQVQIEKEVKSEVLNHGSSASESHSGALVIHHFLVLPCILQ